MSDQVVCIRDDFSFPSFFYSGRCPVKGHIYTVTHAFDEYGKTWFNLSGFPSLVAWEATWFRPVTKRSTDISIFKRLLEPGAVPIGPKKILEDA